MPRGHKIDLRNCTFRIKDLAIVAVVPALIGCPSTVPKYAVGGLCNNQLGFFGGFNIGTSTPSQQVWRYNDAEGFVQLANAPWPARVHAAMIYKHPYTYVVGGVGASGFLNDIWRTTNFVDWTKVGEFPLTPPNSVQTTHAWLKSDNTMWVIIADSAGFSILYSDAGNFNSWNGGSGWAPVVNQSFLYVDPYFYVFGGYDTIQEIYTSTVIRTTDFNRYEVLCEAPWSPRIYPSVGYDGTYFYMCLGQNATEKFYDCWKSTDCVNWTYVGVYTPDPGEILGATYSNMIQYNDTMFVNKILGNNHFLYLDEDHLVTTQNSVEILIGAGDLFHREQRGFDYLREKGRLDEVKEGADIPLEVEFQFKWNKLTSLSGEPKTIEEVLKNRAGWTSTSTDGYAIDIEILNAKCNGDQETFLFPGFRYETLIHQIKEGYVKCSGKCNATEATVTREDA